MPDWTPLRLKAYELNLRLRVRLPKSTTPLLKAEALLAMAEEEAGISSIGLSPDDPLLAGAHAVLDRATPCIWYALDRRSAASQRFARAHELAHFWLHPDIDADTCTVSDDPDAFLLQSGTLLSSQIEEGYSAAERREKEANLFASELLLPGPILHQVFVSQRWTARRIARYVGVSESYVLAQLARALLLPPLPEPKLDANTETNNIPGPALDPSQAAAAMVKEGPVLIDAGPGTGKTRTLIARLVDLLEVRNIHPENILALTFSNKAAEEMRTRLRVAVGSLSDRVWIGTFHAFGLELLRKEGHRIGLPPSPTLLETADAVALLERHLDRLHLQEFEYLFQPIIPFPDILQCISRAKDELNSPADYLRLAQEQLEAAGADPKQLHAAQQSLEIAGIYAVYQQLLKQEGLLDFGDLIMRAVELLDTCPDVRTHWQARYAHILADEYQDINRASAQMLQRLAGQGRGFWAVGDLRQAIYRFRGASPANIHDFNHDFPDGRRLRLEHNYRSRSTLVALFQNFASQMPGNVDTENQEGNEEESTVTWQARRADGPETPITIAIADDEEAQAQGIAEQIRQWTEQGVVLKDQAILCHTNRQASELAKRLETYAIPTQHLGGLFEREEVKDLLALLSLACEPEGSALARVARFHDYAIPSGDVTTLLQAARSAKQSFPGALALAVDLPELSEEGRRGLLLLNEHLKSITFRGSAWLLLSRYLFDSSAYLYPLLQNSPVHYGVNTPTVLRLQDAPPQARSEGLQPLDSVLPADLSSAVLETSSIASGQSRLALYQLLLVASKLSSRFKREYDDARAQQVAFLSHLRFLLACGQERTLKVGTEADSLDGVRIMTIHQSKGLEFPIVYLPNLIEGQFPPRKGSQMAAPPPQLTLDLNLVQAKEHERPNGNNTEARNQNIEQLVEDMGEECLFFVALSRARDHLILSRPSKWRNRTTKPCQLLTKLEPVAKSLGANVVVWGKSAPLLENSVDLTPAPFPGSLTTFAEKGGFDGSLPSTSEQEKPIYSLSALEQYRRCPRQFYYQRVARLPERDTGSLYLAFHTGFNKTLLWLENERRAGRFPDYTEVATMFNNLWRSQEANVESGHGRVLHTHALQLLTTAHHSTEQPQRVSQEFIANLEHGRVRLKCDHTEELPDGTLRIVDYALQSSEDDHTNPKLALLREAARQQNEDRPIQVAIGYRRSGEHKEVKESKRWEPARVDKYNIALQQINSGKFEADPEPRKCATCPFFLICPA